VSHLTEGIIFTVTAVTTSDIASYASISNEPFVTLSLYRKVALSPPRYTAAAQTLPELYPVVGDGMGNWKWLFDHFIL
jgi:hypothetical protein